MRVKFSIFEQEAIENDYIMNQIDNRVRPILKKTYMNHNFSI